MIRCNNCGRSFRSEDELNRHNGICPICETDEFLMDDPPVTMASDLVRMLNRAIEKYGDMPILIRSPEDGADWSAFSVNADPPSESEKEEGISGTIDITFW